MKPCSACGRPTGVEEEGPLFRDDGWLSSLAFTEVLDETLLALRRRHVDLCDTCFATQLGPKNPNFRRWFQFLEPPYWVTENPFCLQNQIVDGWALPLQESAAGRRKHEVPSRHYLRQLPFQVSMSLDGRFHWSSMTDKTLPVPLHFKPQQRLWSLYEPAPNRRYVFRDPLRRPNPWSWPGYQEEVERWLGQHSLARELLADTPVLLWLLLAPPLGSPKFSAVEIERLLSRSRRAILQEVFAADRLGLETAPQVSLSLLRKFTPQDWSSSEAEEIFKAIKTPKVLDTVRYQPSITPLDLWAMRSYPFLRDHGLSELLSGHLHEDGPLAYQLRVATRWAQDTVEAAEALDLDHHTVKRAFSGVDTLRALWDHRCRWRRKAGLSVDDASSNGPLFPPPIQGSKSIIPLRTTEELQEEGRQMVHCVGSYAESVQRGRCFIYKVLRPSRATLSIEPDGQGGWRIASLKGRRNARASRSMEVYVERWLKQRQGRGAPGAGEGKVIPIRGHAPSVARSAEPNER